MSLEVIVEEPKWYINGLEALAQSAYSNVISHFGYKKEFEVSILGCDNKKIELLNQKFRSKPSPTNILSFPSKERRSKLPGITPKPINPLNEFFIGDIAISYDYCRNESKKLRNFLFVIIQCV